MDAALEELKAHPALASAGRSTRSTCWRRTWWRPTTRWSRSSTTSRQARRRDARRRGQEVAHASSSPSRESAFELRKLLGPQRDIFNELSRRDFPFITGENQVYFQDVYSRMIRMFDMMDTIREMLSGNLDIYLSTVSNRLNEVMKVLTVVATILMTAVVHHRVLRHELRASAVAARRRTRVGTITGLHGRAHGWDAVVVQTEEMDVAWRSISMADKLRTLMVGCGSISGTWLRRIKGNDEIEIVGLVDINEDAARRRKEEYGLEAR